MGNKFADKRKMIENVAKSIVEKKLVLFIGAGFAMNIQLPSWEVLIKELIEQKEIHEKLQTDRGKLLKIKNLIEYGHYSEAAELIKENSGLKDFSIKQKLIEILSNSTSEADDNTDDSYRHLKELYECGATKIVTTNYDESIERILGLNKAEVLYPKSNLENINSIREKIINDSYYLKLHGTVLNADSMILFETDYRDKYILKDQIPELLKELFTHNRILFLGCGLTDKYMDIYEKLKKRNAVLESYAICKNGELEGIASRNNIIRITIDDYKELPELLGEILERTRQYRQESAKKIIFDDVPLETYDYNTANSFFKEMKKKKAQGCYFFNTQVEFSAWFSPALQLHLFQQMEAANKHTQSNFDHFRILFLPYDTKTFHDRISKHEHFKQGIKAMVKIHQSMHCKLAFVTSDILKTIIESKKDFFDTYKRQIGLDDLDSNNLTNLDKILKNQIQNGYRRKNDLDFSVIKMSEKEQNSEKEITTTQIWQANFDEEEKQFIYNQLSKNEANIYIKLFDIMYSLIDDEEKQKKVTNPLLSKKKRLYNLIGIE